MGGSLSNFVAVQLMSDGAIYTATENGYCAVDMEYDGVN